jgi:NADH-quinone oxidoreductase subunit I
MNQITHYFKSLLLLELLQGLWLTFKYTFKPKYTMMYPMEKFPQSPRFRGLHALRRYPNGEERCPVDSIVETHILEYHFENRGENIVTKPQLLAIGDRLESEIAERRAADAAFR